MTSAFMIVFVSMLLGINNPNFMTAPVACGSDSMGLMMGCNDTLIISPFNISSDRLHPGGIYIYSYGNSTRVHRFIQCADDNCSDLIFKGDNNLWGEKIPRKDIKYKVLGVVWKND